MTTVRRRGLLAGFAALGLGGCGFRPLYMAGRGRAGPAAELAAVYVPVIPERSGQLLRQALQQRLEGSGGGIKRYELIASNAISAEGIGIQRDSSATRVRLIGNSAWTLRLLDPGHTVLARGTSRVLDGYNILNQQYFAADIEASSAYRRVAETLADQIVTRVAVVLKRRAAEQPRA